MLYLGTIVSDLREIRADIARLDSRIDETNKRIDETNKRIEVATYLAGSLTNPCFTPTHFSFDTDEMSAPSWLIEPRLYA